jgi:hypothetical protein
MIRHRMPSLGISSLDLGRFRVAPFLVDVTARVAHITKPLIPRMLRLAYCKACGGALAGETKTPRKNPSSSIVDTPSEPIANA